jgi:hypothetical protein
MSIPTTLKGGSKGASFPRKEYETCDCCCSNGDGDVETDG